MAIMFPSSEENIKFRNDAEKEIYIFLREMLPNDCYVFYEMCIGGSYPDFIIAHPMLGIIVLEVKAWSEDYITRADKTEFVVYRNEYHANPLKQALGYAHNVINSLREHEELCQTAIAYANKLKFTWGHGVVFPNMTKSEYKFREFDYVIDENFVLLRDDIDQIRQSNRQDSLFNKLSCMIPKDFSFEELTPNEMGLIRKILHGESHNYDNSMRNSSSVGEDTYIRPMESLNPRLNTNFEVNKKLHKRSPYSSAILFLFFPVLALLLLIPLYATYHYPDSYIAVKSNEIYASISEIFNNKILASQPETTQEEKPNLSFIVGSYTNAKGTYFLIKDGKKTILNTIYPEGTAIDFYSDKKIIIHNPDSILEEFVIVNDIVILEVGNDFTKIYHHGEEIRYRKFLRYDFVNDKILNR